MSDSEADIPSAATIERQLREVTLSTFTSGGETTVNGVRTAVEAKLSLPDGYLKNAEWKKKSAALIRETIENDEPTPPSSPKPSKAASKAASAPAKKAKASKDVSSARGTKRKATAPSKQAPKRKKSRDSDASLSDDDNASASDVPPTKPARRQKKVVEEDSDETATPQKPSLSKAQRRQEDSDDDDATAPSPKSEKASTPAPTTKGDASESEMSEVLDESPVKKRGKKKEATSKRAKAPKTKAKPAKSQADDDPDQAEIKRLQGWLVKCGIRKVWGKELAKCDTPKDKIRHLKGLLKDAGMDGKYSVEKAAKIKEQREFAKDLEEIQAGAMAWGQADAAAALVAETGRPRRRAAARAVQKPVPKLEIDEDDEEAEDNADEGSSGDSGSDDDHHNDEDTNDEVEDDDGVASDEEDSE